MKSQTEKDTQLTNNFYSEELQKKKTKFTEESLKILKFYNKNECTTIEALIQILRRLNLVWEQVCPLSYEGRELKYRNFSKGSLHPVIHKLAEQNFFYRLNYIKQLSSTSMAVDLGATHTRLEHSIGVAAFAEVYLDILSKTLESESEKKPLQPYEMMAVRIYAFIHDAFHGPFGHSLELMSNIFNPNPTNIGWKVDKYYLHKNLSSNDEFISLIKDVLKDYIENDKIDDVIKLVRILANKNEHIKLEDRYFLAQIGDSTIDADRLDYIHRDSYYLNAGSSPNENETHNMLRRMKLHDTSLHSSIVKIIAFSDADDNYINNVLLHLRRQHYENVYHNKYKIALDEMIAHAIFYIIMNIDSNLVKPNMDEEPPEIIQEIHKLTDDGLIHFIYDVGNPFISIELAHDILTKNYYIPVLVNEISIEQIAEIEKYIKVFNIQYEKEINSLKEEFKNSGIQLGNGEIPKEKTIGITKKLTEKWPDFVLKHYFTNIYRGDFYHKYNFEVNLWDKLIKNSNFLKFFNNYLATRYGYITTMTDESKEQIKELKDFPHIFISIPPFPAISEDKWKDYDQEVELGDTLYIYDKSGECSKGKDTPIRKRSEPPKMIVYAPPYLANNETVKGIIEKAFSEMIKERSWLIKPIA